MNVINVLGVWIAAFLTLAIFSFLYKDNPIYKFAEHLVVGVSAGYWVTVLYHTSLTDLLITPLVNVWSVPDAANPEKRVFAPGAPFASGQAFLALVYILIPLAFGIMMLCRLHPKTTWLGRIAIAFFLGTALGAAIPLALQVAVIQPLRYTLLPVIPSAWTAWIAGLMGRTLPAGPVLTAWGALNNLLIVAGVFCALVYFFFSVEHKGIARRAAGFGIWVLMIGFGSTFGFTVMSRVSLLVGRFEFLLNTWFRENFLNLFG